MHWAEFAALKPKYGIWKEISMKGRLETGNFSGMSKSISLFLDASYDTYLIHGLYYIQPLIYPPPLLPHLVNMKTAYILVGGLAVEREAQSLHEKTSLSV